MLDELKKAFYGVMYKYEKSFSELGVLANLEAWRQNKDGLLTLLRQHPSWDEDALAIVFRFKEERTLDNQSIDECKFEMLEFASKAIDSDENRNEFSRGLDLATLSYCKNITAATATAIRENCGVKCAEGQKASRVINKLCLKYGISDKQGYNSIFARLADSLNPTKIPKTGVLSIHPCDFLEMSNRDNPWKSCHRIDGGIYQGGCLSYLNDYTSMIFYTVDNSVVSEFYKVPKLTREIFCYSDNVLLQSRLYPTDNNETRTLYRAIIQKAIADCLKAPNLWKTIRDRKENSEYYQSAPNSTHYPDYECGYAIVSLLKSADTHGLITVGIKPYCVCCGMPFDNHYQLKCNCEDLVICSDCGESVPQKNANYHDGIWSCNSCLRYCDHCQTRLAGQGNSVLNRYGESLTLCDRCTESLLEPCAGCSVFSVCQTIGAAYFCERLIIQVPKAA